MRWGQFLRSFPKVVIVIGMISISTIGFFVWRVTYRARHILDALNQPHSVPVEDMRPKIAKVEIGHERMLLVDNDLYDLESGELLFRGWLKEGMPEKLFWERDSKTVLAEYDRGFVRYSLDGAIKASLPLKNRFGIADDRKWVVFPRDRDICRADVDWRELKLVNERKLTSLAQFNDVNFAGNIVLGTDKTLVVRNMNQIVRVNMETGDVHPTMLPLMEIVKRRSPDSKSVVGLQNGQFFCYDVDMDVAKSIQVGRGAINDYQWLDNDRCVAIAGGTKVILYDRKRNTLNEVVTLPTHCQKIGEPSSDGRFLFCYSWKGGDLVDVEKKNATPIKGGAGIVWVSNDTYALSRDVQDTDLRGTWLQKAAEPEKRISPQPYLVNTRGVGFILAVPKAGVVVFATRQGLSRMKPDGSELSELVKLTHVPERLVEIQDEP